MCPSRLARSEYRHPPDPAPGPSGRILESGPSRPDASAPTVRAVSHAKRSIVARVRPALRRALTNARLPFRVLLATERGALVRGSLAVPIAAGLSLALPWILGRAVDALVAADGDVQGREITGYAIAFAAVAVLEGTLRWIGRHQLINASRRVEERIKNRIADHLQRLPLEWFDRVGGGDVISRMTQDVELLRFLIGPTILYGAQSAVIVPGGLVVMILVAPWVALAVGVVMLLLTVSIVALMPHIHRHSKEVQAAIGKISDRAQEDFQGARVWLAFGRTAQQTQAMRGLADEYVAHNVRLVRARALLNLFIHATRSLVILAVVAVGAFEAYAGRITIGDLLVFLGLLGIMMWPLLAVGFLLGTTQRSLAAAERIAEILDTRPATGLPARVDDLGVPRRRDPSPTENAYPTPGPAPRIEVRGLSFTYPGRNRPALDDVSFELAAGGFLGLVGPIGGGKSTLLALLLRLREPPPGTVFVDGVDVLELDPAVLRRRFAFAEQEAFLFSDSIRGNVLFGHHDARASRRVTVPGEVPGEVPGDGDARDAGTPHDPLVVSALRDAALGTDIASFAEGVETVVGERGTTLSGGQKQRTQLARAFASARPALLLDDALSAVDQRTEREILDRLANQRQNRTVIATAHRLSLVRHADAILWLEEGRVREHGTHDELVRRQSGQYASTWRRQAEAAALGGERGLG